MSFGPPTDLFSTCADELPGRQNGKRVIGHFGIELSDEIPHHEILGRTDWFHGRQYDLTFQQMVELRDKLTRSIDHYTQLEAAGHVVLKKD